MDVGSGASNGETIEIEIAEKGRSLKRFCSDAAVHSLR